MTTDRLPFEPNDTDFAVDIDEVTGEIIDEHPALMPISTARRMLAEARNTNELKNVRDLAEAARLWAREHKLGLEAQNEAAEIAIRAAREVGKIIPTEFPQGRPEKTSFRTTFSDIGITRDQSSRWQKLAEMPDPIFEQFITETKADGEELTTAGALRIVKERQCQTRTEEKNARAMSLPQSTYNVIYADPPWQYSNTGVHGAADHHYPTMPTARIAELLDAIDLQVADNAVLFLWVTNPLLIDATQVIDAWGFEYKTNIVWVKTDLQKPGSGFYVRGRHELLFICTRGSFTPLDQHIAPPIGSVVTAPVQDHSTKPDEVYDIIERLYPDCSYIELFARRTRDGWDGYGYDYPD